MRNSEYANLHPHPGADPVARLKHALDVYSGVEDERWALVATSGLHGASESTGLTFGDLRALARMVGA